jgi:hypothetical protein
LRSPGGELRRAPLSIGPHGQNTNSSWHMRIGALYIYRIRAAAGTGRVLRP